MLVICVRYIWTFDWPIWSELKKPNRAYMVMGLVSHSDRVRRLETLEDAEPYFSFLILLIYNFEILAIKIFLFSWAFFHSRLIILMLPNLWIFSFDDCAFDIMFKKFSLHTRPWTLFPIFSFKSFIISSVTFRHTIEIILYREWGMDWGFFSFLSFICIWVSNCSSTINWKDYLFSVKSLRYCWKSIAMCLWAYIWILCFIPLIYVLNLLLIPSCFGYSSTPHYLVHWPHRVF